MNHQFHTIDGRAIAEEILLTLRRKIVESGKTPGLAVILVGDDPSSKLYIRNKERACQKVGIEFHKYFCNGEGKIKLPQREIIDIIQFLNQDPTISGIVVQLPLPKGYDTDAIISAIDPKKDADGFHPKNIEKILEGKSKKYPPLINTLLCLIASQNIALKNKKISVLVKSDVLKPVLKKVFEDAESQITFSNLDEALEKKTLQDADIVITLLGNPECIKGEMLKKDAAVIDVGITRTPKGFSGDADFESIKKVASCATPTPGGVGPVTIAMLLKNVQELSRA